MSKPGPPFWCVRSTNSKAPIFLGASGCWRGSGQALGELATYQLPLQSFHLFSVQQDPKDVLSHSVQIPAGGRRDRDERCHLSGGGPAVCSPNVFSLPGGSEGRELKSSTARVPGSVSHGASSRRCKQVTNPIVSREGRCHALRLCWALNK